MISINLKTSKPTTHTHTHTHGMQRKELDQMCQNKHVVVHLNIYVYINPHTHTYKNIYIYIHTYMSLSPPPRRQCLRRGSSREKAVSSHWALHCCYGRYWFQYTYTYSLWAQSASKQDIGKPAAAGIIKSYQESFQAMWNYPNLSHGQDTIGCNTNGSPMVDIS